MAGFDTSSLRVLGSVGEPIAPEVWKWYSDFMGNDKAYITDVSSGPLHLIVIYDCILTACYFQTYWQTETGSHIIAAMAGVTPMKPGSASLPCFGIDAAIIDPVSGKELEGCSVEGVLAIKQPWPSMARTIRGDHRRYTESYLDVYKGYYVREYSQISRTSRMLLMSFKVHRRRRVS